MAKMTDGRIEARRGWGSGFACGLGARRNGEVRCGVEYGKSGPAISLEEGHGSFTPLERLIPFHEMKNLFIRHGGSGDCDGSGRGRGQGSRSRRKLIGCVYQRTNLCLP